MLTMGVNGFRVCTFSVIIPSKIYFGSNFSTRLKWSLANAMNAFGREPVSFSFRCHSFTFYCCLFICCLNFIWGRIRNFSFVTSSNDPCPVILETMRFVEYISNHRSKRKVDTKWNWILSLVDNSRFHRWQLTSGQLFKKFASVRRSY